MKNPRIKTLTLAVALSVGAFAASATIETVVGSYNPDGLPATAAPMYPYDVAVHSSGSYYIADTTSYVYKVDAAGRVFILAGNGFSGFRGDGGPAVQASLRHPRGIAVGVDGQVYVADTNNGRIRKVGTDGTITTVAGNGSFGFSGDGGPATSAGLNRPNGVAVDTAGNLYIADTFNHRIRKVDPWGTITTVAGDGTAGHGGDGGSATTGSLNRPSDVEIDGSGNLYVADRYSYRIRKVAPDGTITTVAGNGSFGFSGDGGPATSARLGNLSSITVDGTGNLLFSDTFRIRKVDPSATITTVAGNGTYDYSGDGGPATSASFRYPEGVAVDTAGNLYIADSSNGRIRKVNTWGTVATVAGNGEPQFFGDGGPAAVARLGVPSAVRFDGAGNLFVADTGNHRVRKVDPQGTITTFAGNGINGSGGDGGPATAASLSVPYGLAVDAHDNLYVVDRSAHRVRKVDGAGTITTVAGDGTAGFSGDGGPATSASLRYPNGIAFDTAGNLYVADGHNQRIRRVNADGSIETVAGTGVAGYSGDGGPATSARLRYPTGVLVDAAGLLFISDTSNHVVRRVDLAGTIETVAGNGTYGSDGDGGPATGARLALPRFLAMDTAGNLYVADTQGHRIRKVDTRGTITTVAGSGTYGFSGDGGPARSASLAFPWAVEVDALGNLYIADHSNNRIRRVTSSPPVCGDVAPVTTECTGSSTAIVLDGSAAADPDGDPIAFSWTTDCPAGSFDDTAAPITTLTFESAAPGICGPSECTATLTVTDDGGLTDTCGPIPVSVTDTTAPVIALEGEAALTMECSVDVFTDPGASPADACDPNVDVIVGGTTVDPTTVGEYLLTYDAADSCGNDAIQATRTVDVADTMAPAIEQLVASRDQLWPPNHRMAEVTVSAVAADACDGAPTCAIVAVTSDEPIDGTGDGDTAPDWQIVDGSTVLLRAERAGGGDGRVYAVSVSCADAAGNAAVGEVTVSVPLSRGG